MRKYIGSASFFWTALAIFCVVNVAVRSITTTAKPTVNVAEAKAEDVCEEMCGLVVPQRTVKIVGGHNTNILAYPFVSVIKFTVDRCDGERPHYCSGVILDAVTIATAAHCLIMNQIDIIDCRIRSNFQQETDDWKPNKKIAVPPQLVEIFVGIDKLNIAARGLEVARVSLHKKYSWPEAHDDVGLVTLKKPLSFGPKINRICVPEQYDETNGDLAIVLGFGENVIQYGNGQFRSTPNVYLREATVSLTDRAYCESLIGPDPEGTAHPFLCAGALEKGVTRGDSGGPLVSIRNGRYVLLGTTSIISAATVNDDAFTYRNVYSDVYTKMSSYCSDSFFPQPCMAANVSMSQACFRYMDNIRNHFRNMTGQPQPERVAAAAAMARPTAVAPAAMTAQTWAAAQPAGAFEIPQFRKRPRGSSADIPWFGYSERDGRYVVRDTFHGA